MVFVGLCTDCRNFLKNSDMTFLWFAATSFISDEGESRPPLSRPIFIDTACQYVSPLSPREFCSLNLVAI